MTEHSSDIPETQARRRRRWPWIALAALLLGAAGFLLSAPLFNVQDAVLEAGEPLSSALFFVHPDEDAQILTDLDAIDCTVPGEYRIEIRTRMGVARRTLVVQDTTPPSAAAQDVQTFLGNLPDPADCIGSLSDVTDVDIRYSRTPDVSTPGEQTGAVLLTDAAGNETEIEICVLVLADTRAPVIEGVRDYTMFVGFPVDYMGNIRVSDDYDENPTLTIDDSSLDMQKAGEYTVTYTATDFSGNEAVLSAVITVLEDTLAPTLSGVKNLSVYAGNDLDYTSGVTVSDNYDENPVLTIDDTGLDLSTPGEYTVTYTAADFSGNIVSATAIIRVLDDVEPPLIEGVSDHTLFLGDSVDYISGVQVTDNQDPSPVLEIDDSRVDLSAAGVYGVLYTATDNFGNESTAVSKITIVADKEKPVITGVQDYDVYLGDSVDYVSGVSATDNRDSELSIEIDAGGLDFNTARTYTVTYTCTDSSGNTAKETARIRVKKDTTAPVIEGAQDISVELGGTVSYKKGVSVTDNHDPNPTLTIDNSAVNLSKVGTYKVYYTATDSSGNRNTVTIRVNVTRRTLTEDDLDLIWPLVDDVLDDIITDDMTDMQKAFKIYGWTKKHIRYSGYSDKSYWVMGAYDGLTSRAGDCYTYFSVSKALLTRAGIANVDVEKSDTRVSRHYWSLIDLGTGWYHFDCCRFAAPRANFFMVTDKELAKWDATYRNAHPFDSSLYPERATESVQSMLDYSKFEVKD